jgi:hypothetical protein
MTDKFTKPILRNIRDIFDESLKKYINDMYDNKFEFHLGNCSFDEDQAKFQLIVTFRGNSVQDIARKKEKEDLEQYAKYSGIDLERKHPRYTLIGYKVKSRKLPWIVLDNQKKGEYIISDDQAKKLFGKLDVDTFLKGQRKAQSNG